MSTDLVAVVESSGTLEKLQKAMPRHLNPERFARIMVTELNANPDLKSCEPASFLSAMIRVAQLGLEVGKDLGQAYFIPFENRSRKIVECQLIVGYRGLRSLALRGGKIKRIDSRCVYAGDHFRVSYGLDENLEHEPLSEPNATNLTHVYAVAVYADGSRQFEIMTRKQIDAIRDRGRRNPVWNSDYEEMARKTVLRRLTKALDLSPELADGLRADDEDDLALPPSRQPAKILEAQASAAAAENESLTTLRDLLVEASKRIAARGGVPAEVLGAVAVNRAHDWLSFEEAAP